MASNLTLAVPPVAAAFLGFALFSTMDLLLKLATAENVSPFQILFFLNGSVFLSYMALMAIIGYADFKPRRRKLHWIRSAFNFVAAICNVLSFEALDLSYFYSLLFMAPLLTTVLARVFLKEAVSSYGWLGIFIGFGGILVAFQPWNQNLTPVHYVPFVSALFLTCSNLTVKKMGMEESPLSIAFFSATLYTVVFGVISAFDFRVPSGEFIGLVMLSGVLMSYAVLFVGYAFQKTSVTTVGMIQYTQFIWGMFYTTLFFGAFPNVYYVVGALLICFGGVIGGGNRIFRIKWF